jgi:hypothetical protein
MALTKTTTVVTNIPDISASIKDDMTSTGVRTYIDNQLVLKSSTSHTHSTYAPLANPTFTGVPAAPAPAIGDDSTRIATTSFVRSYASSTYLPLSGGLMSGPLTLNAAPTASMHAATKAYVDSVSGGGSGGGSYAQEFKSSPISISGTVFEKKIAHGLGGLPDEYSAHLVCTVAGYGYSVGDEVTPDSFGLNHNLSVWASASEVGITSKLSLSALEISDRTNTGYAPISIPTPISSNWALVLIARKFVSVASVAGTAWQTVTRSINTVYQNLTGSNLAVSVHAEIPNIYNSGSVNVNVSPTGSAPWKDVGHFTANDGANSGEGISTRILSIVPTNYYYKVTTSGTVTTINNWEEMTLGSGGGSTYTLPTASGSTLGGVKVGSGLAIDGSGILSATGGGSSVAATNWVDVTSTRSLVTTYTNSSGSIKAVLVSSDYYSGISSLIPTVGGVALPSANIDTGSSRVTAFFLVPNGTTYSVSGVSSFSSWAEMTLGSGGATALPARTWQNFSTGIGGRSPNTAYQNTTGQDIVVAVADSAYPGQILVGTTSNPATVLPYTAGSNVTVPNGWYYKYYMAGQVGTITWMELRA